MGWAAKRRRRMQVGTIFDEKGFASTSLSGRRAAGFGEYLSESVQTVYQIVAPKRLRAVVENNREAEMLLPRGTRFRVLERHQKFEFREVDLDSSFTRTVDNFYVLEVLPPAPA